MAFKRNLFHNKILLVNAIKKCDDYITAYLSE